MKTNPLLEELWRVKDALAREAGYDLDRIFAELRAAETRQPGQRKRSTLETQKPAERHPEQTESYGALQGSSGPR
jgi:hypothetical protein